MAILKDSLITGDLRVTGTIYGEANLSSLNASGTGVGTNGQILTSTGTGLAWTDAASSHSHSQYVLKAGDTVTGTLILSKTTDLSGTANNKPALIVGGADTAAHMEIDANEIQGKTNGTSVAGIYINNDGGLVTIGSGGLASTATADATSSTAAAVKSAGGLAVGKKIWVGSTLGASSNDNTSSQLIISSSDTGAGGNVALELWRGTKASWQLSNEGGDFHIRTNYTTAKQSTYSVDAVKVAYNTGTVTLKTALPVGSGGTGTSTAPTKGGIIYASSTSAYASTAAGSSGQYLKSGGSNAPEWASFVKPVVSWTAGTANGPTLAVQATGGTSTAVAVPSASASASGIVTTGSQTFAGTKTFNGDSFYVQANEVRFKNKGNNNTAITNKPYSFRLNIGDGEYIHLSEYNDDDLEIHGSSILLTTTNYAIYNETAAYSAGNIVWYNGQYYRCTTAIASGGEAWNSSHWTALPMTAIMAANHINPWVTETYDLGSSSYKWNNLYAKKINGTAIASVTAQTTQAVYPIKINAIGQITAYGSAVTLGTLASKSSIADHTYVKATGTSRSTDVALNSTTVLGSVKNAGAVPTLGTNISADDITAWTTNTPTQVTKKSVVISASGATASYSAGILTITDGSFSTGDSVSVTEGTPATLSYTARSIPNVTSAGSMPTFNNATVATATVKTQPAFSITTENATLSHTIS